MSIYAVAAPGFAAIWVFEVVEVFEPNFNEDRTLSNELLIGQAVVGVLGVVATAVAGGAGLAFAGTATRRWLAWAGLGSVVALPLLVVWLFVLAGPAGSS